MSKIDLYKVQQVSRNDALEFEVVASSFEGALAALFGGLTCDYFEAHNLRGREFIYFVEYGDEARSFAKVGDDNNE